MNQQRRGTTKSHTNLDEPIEELIDEDRDNQSPDLGLRKESRRPAQDKELSVSQLRHSRDFDDTCGLNDRLEESLF